MWAALVGGMLSVAARAADEQRSPVRFSVDLREEYTDNRDAVERNAEGTFDTYLTPRIAVGFDLQPTILDFRYEPALRWRSDPSPFENEFMVLHDVGLKLQLRPAQVFTLRAGDDFYYTDDPKVEEDGAIVRGDRSYYLNRPEVGVNWKFTRQSELDFYARYSTKRYDAEDAAQLFDEDKLDTGVTYFQRLVPRFGLKLVGRYNDYGYKDFGGYSRDFAVLMGGLGAEYAVTRQTRAGAIVGWENVEYDDDRFASENGPYGELTFRGALLPVLRVEGAIAHGFRDSDGDPQRSVSPSQEYSQFLARLEWDASDMLTLGGGATYRLGNYDVDTKWPMAGVSGDENVLVAGVDASIKVAPHMRVKASYKFENVDSDVRESYTKNTAAVGVGATF